MGYHSTARLIALSAPRQCNRAELPEVGTASPAGGLEKPPSPLRDTGDTTLVLLPHCGCMSACEAETRHKEGSLFV